jgi:hypothetical protein
VRNCIYSDVGSCFYESLTMEIIDPETKSKILDKLGRHRDIRYYYDHHELSDDEVSEKYGFYGLGQRNFFEIRFYPQTNALTQLQKLLSPETEYLILPIDNSRKIYKGKLDLLNELFASHDPAKVHVIIAETRYNWILIKNEFNKLIGMGNEIKKKIEKKIYMAFEGEKLMYWHSDKKNDE